MDSAKECFAQDVIYTLTNERLMDVWNDYCDFSGREDKSL